MDVMDTFDCDRRGDKKKKKDCRLNVHKGSDN